MDGVPADDVGDSTDEFQQTAATVSRSDAAVNVANGATQAAGSEENKFRRAISAWRNIDLTNLIPTLDTTASDLAASQRDALVERKELAQKTKDFRRLDDAAKLTEIKGLLKAYQTYIDLVTNQSKAVSSSFFQVYSSLSEAPDPYPLLEASVDSLLAADETMPRLEAENKHLQDSTAKLSNQLEDSEKKLEDERTMRLAVEEARQTRIKEVEASWSAVLAEKQGNWDSREKALQEKADHQERLLKELKASYEVSQRLERGERDGEWHGLGATAVELEMITSDLEQANSRLAEVGARNEQLRLELAQLATQQGTSSAPPLSLEDDPGFLRLRAENSSLLRKLDAARLDKESQERAWETSSRSLRKENAALSEDAQALRFKVSKWSDYEDIKQELEILKSIEFATGDNEDILGLESQAVGGDKTGQENKPAKQNEEQNLEQLLLSRNKKLSNELTVLRVSHQDLASRLETLQIDLSRTNMELERSQNLNATLENDLAKLQNETSSPQPQMSVAGSRYPSSSYVGSRRTRVSPTSSIISGIEPSHSYNAFERGDPLGSGSGILPMITAQRDRFKKRNTELEAELSKTHQVVNSLRSEISSLQKDNLNLYERTRYVSTYSRSQPAASSSGYAPNPNPSAVQVSDNASALDRYRPAYESKISPFAAFRGRESARAFRRMTLPERVIFQITRMVLATRTSRNLFAFYCMGLHLLVFGMLYYTSTVEIDQHMTHLADSTVNAFNSPELARAKYNFDELRALDTPHEGLEKVVLGT